MPCKGYTVNTDRTLPFRFFCSLITLKEDRLSLLHFTTGNSALPLEGFIGFTNPFKITRSANPKDSLPTASTCINNIKQPQYSSQETMKEKILIAITFGSCGFSFG